MKQFYLFMTDKWPHHWTMKPNLEYIQQHGLERWLEAQTGEWTCRRISGLNSP